MLKKVLLTGLLLAAITITSDSTAHAYSYGLDVNDVIKRVNLTKDDDISRRGFEDGFSKKGMNASDSVFLYYREQYAEGQKAREVYDKGQEDGFYHRRSNNKGIERKLKDFYRWGYNKGVEKISKRLYFK